MSDAVFVVVAVALLAGAAGVVVLRRTMYAAMSLVVAFMAVAGIYLLIGAQFIGFIQLIVYAGAVMVLFLVVILLLDPYHERPLRNSGHIWPGLAALIGVSAFVFLYLGIAGHTAALGPPAEVVASGPGHVRALARLLFDKYLLPFELVGILILVAIVGAVRLARRRS